MIASKKLDGDVRKALVAYTGGDMAVSNRDVLLCHRFYREVANLALIGGKTFEMVSMHAAHHAERLYQWAVSRKLEVSRDSTFDFEYDVQDFAFSPSANDVRLALKDYENGDHLTNWTLLLSYRFHQEMATLSLLGGQQFSITAGYAIAQADRLRKIALNRGEDAARESTLQLDHDLPESMKRRYDAGPEEAPAGEEPEGAVVGPAGP